MAKLSKEELDRIVQRERPRYKLTDRSRTARQAAKNQTRSARARPEARTPELDQLRRKYLQEKYLGDDNTRLAGDRARKNARKGGNPPKASAPAARGRDFVEDEIISVEPKSAPHALDRGSRPKALVVSGRKRKIIGEQG